MDNPDSVEVGADGTLYYEGRGNVPQPDITLTSHGIAVTGIKALQEDDYTHELTNVDCVYIVFLGKHLGCADDHDITVGIVMPLAAALDLPGRIEGLREQGAWD